jgi:hypothetical protein
MIQLDKEQLNYIGFKEEDEVYHLIDPIAFFNFIVNRDRYYEYSDDASVYRRGKHMEEAERVLKRSSEEAAVVAGLAIKYLEYRAIAHKEGFEGFKLILETVKPFQEDVVKRLLPEIYETVCVLAGGQYDLLNANLEYEQLRLHAFHIGELASNLSKKLVLWKPKENVVSWDSIHVPNDYHQEMKHMLNYISTTVLAINSTIRKRVMPHIKNLDIREDLASKVVTIALPVSRTRYTYLISRRV